MTEPPPDGSWDCHAHVIGDLSRYPLAPGRSYEPPQAPLEAYLRFLDRFGLARGVLIQPSVYGFDNRCMLDALDRASGRLMGVAVPDPATPTGELERMHLRGVRGVRCNLLNPGGLGPDRIGSWQPVMRELGWHVAFHIDVEQVGDLRGFVGQFTVPVVFDHMGRPTPDQVGGDTKRTDGPGIQTEKALPSPGLPHDARSLRPGLRQLVELVREGACFVKLSAPYRLSRESPPWDDVARLARTFLEANPARCLWASDWPHVDTEGPVRTKDLLEALTAWSSNPQVLRIMMRDAPEALLRSV